MRINFKKFLLLTSAVVGIWAYHDYSKGIGESKIRIIFGHEAPDNLVNPAWFTEGAPKLNGTYDPKEYRNLIEKYRVPGSTLKVVAPSKPLHKMSKEELAEYNRQFQEAFSNSGTMNVMTTIANNAQFSLECEIYRNTVAPKDSLYLYEKRCCEGKDRCLIDGLQRWRGLSYEDAQKYLEDHTDTSSGYKNVTMPVEIHGKHSESCVVRRAGGFEIYRERPPIDISKYAKKQDGDPKQVAERTPPVKVYTAGFSPKINTGN